MTNFKTDEFEFKVFSKNEKEIDLIDRLEKDVFVKKYLPKYKEYLMVENNDVDDFDLVDRLTYIVYKDSLAIGMISLYNLISEVVFSIAIDFEHRGNGYASRIKEQVCEYFFENYPSIEKIVGYVKETNTSSLKYIKKSDNEIEKIYDPNDECYYFKSIVYNPKLNKRRR